jgi:hypothetical protein
MQCFNYQKFDHVSKIAGNPLDAWGVGEATNIWSALKPINRRTQYQGKSRDTQTLAIAQQL